jgi:hypothetical protein
MAFKYIVPGCEDSKAGEDFTDTEPVSGKHTDTGK